MTQHNSNKFTIIALLVTSGIIGAVSLGIMFLLDNTLGTVQASSQNSVTNKASAPVDKRVRLTLMGSCKQPVNSLEAATAFLANCDEPKSATAFVNRGRALLITWDSDSAQAQKEQRFNQISESFDKAGELSKNDPEIAFYQAFVLDFKDFVLDGRATDCASVKERYAEAIARYAQIEQIQPEKDNLSIINELGHFLTNRDRDYKAAIALYEKVSLDHPQINDVLMSKATAQLLSQDLPGAQASFEQVLALNPGAYQVKYSLGSLWAQQGNYPEALKYYQAITNNPNTANFYYAWRDQGITHYFLGQYKEAKQSFETALKFEGAALFDKKNYAYMQTASDCLDALSGDESIACFGDNPDVVKSNLRANGIFQGSVIVHSKDEASDPFFEVEHDTFYKCNRT